MVQSMAHAKTQVLIPLEDVYKVKIMNKKELWRPVQTDKSHGYGLSYHVHQEEDPLINNLLL